jgi:hypothetical protein
VTGGSFSPVAALILDLATGVRESVSGQELALIREHVAAAGFSPTLRMAADRRVVGLVPPSGEHRPLARFDLVDVGELHYLRHVIAQQEWPIGATLADYYASGARLARDPRSGVLISTVGRFGIHVGVVGRARGLAGLGGREWMLVEFRLRIGHWATLMHLQRGLLHFNDPDRTRKIWLRLPR